VPGRIETVEPITMITITVVGLGKLFDIKSKYQELCNLIKSDEALTLLHAPFVHPTNSAMSDENCVKVLKGAVHVGWIPRKDAPIVSEWLQGSGCTAKVTSGLSGAFASMVFNIKVTPTPVDIITSAFDTNNLTPTSMKVAELKAELSKRSMSTVGLKAVLTERLLGAIRETKLQPQQQQPQSTPPASSITSSSSSSLTEEQQQRMEQSRQRALQKRQERLAQQAQASPAADTAETTMPLAQGSIRVEQHTVVTKTHLTPAPSRQRRTDANQISPIEATNPATKAATKAVGAKKKQTNPQCGDGFEVGHHGAEQELRGQPRTKRSRRATKPASGSGIDWSSLHGVD
jgi:hypothetical protein